MTVKYSEIAVNSGRMESAKFDEAHAAVSLPAATGCGAAAVCDMSGVDLGDGLVLRTLASDSNSEREALASFNARVHHASVGRTTLHWLNGGHPTLDPSRVTVVVDTTKNPAPIVSALLSIPQVVGYGNSSATVPLRVTRIEAVGTDEAYRGHQLVQRHMDLHHRWAETALDSPLQYIGGIPLYYKRFGYENCPERDGGFAGSLASIAAIVKTVNALPPARKLRVRSAKAADAPFLERLNRHGAARRQALWTDLDEHAWVHLIERRRKSPGAFTGRSVWILEHELELEPGQEPEDSGISGDEDADSTAGLPVAFMVMCAKRAAGVVRFELDDEAKDFSWIDATQAMLAWLPTFYKEYGAEAYKLLRAPYLDPAVPKVDDAKVPESSTPVEQESAEQVQAPTSLQPQAAPAPPTIPEDWKFELLLGRHHPCYKAINREAVVPSTLIPEFWFMRIPSPFKFIQAVIPVLNSRLAQSITFARVTKSILLSKSAGSVANCPIIHVVKGKCQDVAISSKDAKRSDFSVIYFDGTALNRVLLGHKSVFELEATGSALGDHVGMQLLDVLFPVGISDEIMGFD
ncbi:hypothetical protein BC830DRAFT_378115 [Chytriomyces sp. MP71]|nr:hypothetical protein BC830DRAFT_378115 [Chytriomyces sp. MP71]